MLTFAKYSLNCHYSLEMKFSQKSYIFNLCTQARTSGGGDHVAGTPSES